MNFENDIWRGSFSNSRLGVKKSLFLGGLPEEAPCVKAHGTEVMVEKLYVRLDKQDSLKKEISQHSHEEKQQVWLSLFTTVSTKPSATS